MTTHKIRTNLGTEPQTVESTIEEAKRLGEVALDPWTEHKQGDRVVWGRHIEEGWWHGEVVNDCGVPTDCCVRIDVV